MSTDNAMEVYETLCLLPVNEEYAQEFHEKKGQFPRWTPTRVEWNNGNPHRMWARFYRPESEYEEVREALKAAGVEI